MTRLCIEAGEYFEPDDPRDVVNFTTPATLNALGYATSDIAEMGLCLLYTSFYRDFQQQAQAWIFADREVLGGQSQRVRDLPPLRLSLIHISDSCHNFFPYPNRILFHPSSSRHSKTP